VLNYFFGFSDFSMNSFKLFAQASAVFSNWFDPALPAEYANTICEDLGSTMEMLTLVDPRAARAALLPAALWLRL
jgi:hypothetical protein